MTQAVVANSDDFAVQLQQQRNDIVASLPKPDDEDHFISTLHMAVATRPDLLNADRLSFWRAVRQAATDGLRPDGKEGVINAYFDDFAKKKMCVWIPMVLGLRKRAIELASIYIDAEVVHENDHFRVVRGDDPKIEHWEERGEPRGRMTEAYAIFKKLLPTGQIVIVHREVMDANLIAAVKAKVAAKGGLMWKEFEGEAWRKTVVRRGIKSVPAVSDGLMAIFRRDDSLYDFSNSQKPVAGAIAGDVLMPPAISSTADADGAPKANAALPATGSPMMPPPLSEATAAQVATPPPLTAPQQQPAEGKPLDREEVYLGKLEAALKTAKSAAQVQGICDRQERNIENELSAASKQRAFDLIDEYMARFDSTEQAA